MSEIAVAINHHVIDTARRWARREIEPIPNIAAITAHEADAAIFKPILESEFPFDWSISDREEMRNIIKLQVEDASHGCLNAIAADAIASELRLIHWLHAFHLSEMRKPALHFQQSGLGG